LRIVLAHKSLKEKERLGKGQIGDTIERTPQLNTK